MKKIKNKFIITIILLIVIVLSIQFYITYSMNIIDSNSYVQLIKWKWLLNNTFIKVKERHVVNEWDSIRIIWENSYWIIEWWDWSITRLWWNTKIIIKESNISKWKTEINISFDLISWKTWSNVISLMWKDSYFKESFKWIEAWVRGTIFNVDLDKEYINVISHEVTLVDQNGKKYLLEKDKPFSLISFSFIDIKEFIENIKDKTWEDLNKKFDKEYIKWLTDNLNKQISKNNPILVILEIFSTKYRILYELKNGQDYDKIKELAKNLDSEDKEWLYQKVFSYYQNINFVNSDSDNLYKLKILYKKVLLLLTDDSREKDIIIKSSVYDLKNLVWKDNNKLLKDTLSILKENKEIFSNLDLWESLNKIKSWLLDIDSNLKQEIWNNLDSIYKLFDK